MLSLLNQTSLEITESGLVTGFNAIFNKISYILDTPRKSLPFESREDGINLEKFLFMEFGDLAARGIKIEVTNSLRVLSTLFDVEIVVDVTPNKSERTYVVTVEVLVSASPPLTLTRIYQSNV